MNISATPPRFMRQRRFCGGDVLMIMGLVLSLVFVIMLMIDLGDDAYRRATFVIRLFSVLALTLIWILAGIAFGFSFKRQDVLLLLDGWALLIAVMACFGIDPIASLRNNGMDFFVVLAALLIASGTYVVRRQSGTFGSDPTAIFSIYADTEASLQRLKDLADKGLISPEEHGEKRKQVLGRLA